MSDLEDDIRGVRLRAQGIGSIKRRMVVYLEPCAMCRE